VNDDSSGSELKFNYKLIKNELKLNKKLRTILLQVMNIQSN
jgi:hypothetical protein